MKIWVKGKGFSVILLLLSFPNIAEFYYDNYGGTGNLYLVFFFIVIFKLFLDEDLKGVVLSFHCSKSLEIEFVLLLTFNHRKLCKCPFPPTIIINHKAQPPAAYNYQKAPHILHRKSIKHLAHNGSIIKKASVNVPVD